MPQNKKNVATEILVFDFELFIGDRLPRLFVVVLLALDKRIMCTSILEEFRVFCYFKTLYLRQISKVLSIGRASQ